LCWWRWRGRADGEATCWSGRGGGRASSSLADAREKRSRRHESSGGETFRPGKTRGQGSDAPLFWAPKRQEVWPGAENQGGGAAREKLRDPSAFQRRHPNSPSGTNSCGCSRGSLLDSFPPAPALPSRAPPLIFLLTTRRPAAVLRRSPSPTRPSVARLLCLLLLVGTLGRATHSSPCEDDSRRSIARDLAGGCPPRTPSPPLRPRLADRAGD
jgi:hypothetical protein